MSRILKLIHWWFDNWKPDRELSCSFISPIVSISEFLTDIPKICRGQKVKFKCKFFSNMSGSLLLTFILSGSNFVKVFQDIFTSDSALKILITFTIPEWYSTGTIIFKVRENRSEEVVHNFQRQRDAGRLRDP